jgi:hypothetical protein
MYMYTYIYTYVYTHINTYSTFTATSNTSTRFCVSELKTFLDFAFVTYPRIYVYTYTYIYIHIYYIYMYVYTYYTFTATSNTSTRFCTSNFKTFLDSTFVTYTRIYI